jgi:hypothetical protein
MDRYERKARLLPALIAASPLAVAAFCLTQEQVGWWKALGAGVGLEAVLGVGASYLARAAGKRLEEKLKKEWNGFPTTRWLRPNDESHSEQQKSRWRGAIRQLTKFSIPASLGDKSEAEVDKLINDAVTQLRHELRERKECRMVAIYNEDYGFARNLMALRWLWLANAGVGILACSIGSIGLEQKPLVGVALEGIFGLGALLAAFIMPGYVRQCADRYAETLLAAAVAVADGGAGR